MIDLLKRSNVICADTMAEGILKTSGSLRIKGHFKGEIYAKATASVSPTGRVIGTFNALNAEIEGTVEGIVEASEKVNLDKTSCVKGFITAPKLVVEPGATLIGYCVITPHEEKRTKAKENYLKSSNSNQVKTVSFSLPFPTAKKVQVVGEFCEWDESKSLQCFRTQEGKWTAQIQLGSGKYEYLVVADGKVQLDPTNNQKVPNSYGSQNSILVVA